MEVAEVRNAFPQMECLLFPKDNHQAIWELLRKLRDTFGKATISAEDRIRLGSIRSASELKDSSLGNGPTADDFLRKAEATVTFSLGTDSRDARAFELLNKTNQFNLNGKRLTESDWLSFLNSPGAFLLTASYEDKYGPLGKIAVVVGKKDGRRLQVTGWVMSCRAFSRRIEHQCLKYLFEKLDADEIVFAYQPTPRNGPMQDFLSELVSPPLRPDPSIHRYSFKAPDLFHSIVEAANV
jgi:FkbH-like protein